MTGQNQHLGSGQPNLLHFTATVKYPFFVIACGQCAATAAATDLMQPIGVQIHPIVETLIHNPSRLLKKAVAEPFLGASPIIAWIVVCCLGFESSTIKFDAFAFDIFNEQIKNRDRLKFFQGLGKPSLQTVPGR